MEAVDAEVETVNARVEPEFSRLVMTKGCLEIADEVPLTARILSVQGEEATEAEWIEQAESEGRIQGRESATVNTVMLGTLDALHQRCGPEG